MVFFSLKEDYHDAELAKNYVLASLNRSGMKSYMHILVHAAFRQISNVRYSLVANVLS